MTVKPQRLFATTAELLCRQNPLLHPQIYGLRVNLQKLSNLLHRQKLGRVVLLVGH